MATLSAPALTGIYKALEASSQYGSMRRGGIVGDLAHRRRGGYHISRQDQPSTNYSVQAPADKRGPSNLAAGIDLTMSPADMKKMTGRLMAACKKNHADPPSEPRVEPVREFFGTLNGRTVTGWNRYPSSNRRIGYTSSDSSHLWHVHISIFRDYADDPAKIKGLIDILLGVPLKPPTPPAPPTPTPDEEEEDDMPTAQEVWDKDLTLGPGEHSAAWYMRAIYQQGKALVSTNEKILAKLVADDPADAALLAELESVRELLADLADDDEEPPAEVLAAQSAADGEDARPEELKP